MQKDPKLRRATKRIGQVLERSGFRVSFCAGLLSEIFDITCDSIYSPTKDSGIYVRVAIDTITKEMLDAILNYGTPRKKEVWILRYGKSPSDPGTFLIYRIDGRQVIEHPRDWPISKVMSSPKKRQPGLQK